MQDQIQLGARNVTDSEMVIFGRARDLVERVTVRLPDGSEQQVELSEDRGFIVERPGTSDDLAKYPVIAYARDGRKRTYPSEAPPSASTPD